MFSNKLKGYTSLIQIQIRNYAARKGTRERKLKAKVKVEQKKVEFIPHNLRNRDLSKLMPKRFDDSTRSEATDNVFVAKYFKSIRYPFTEAVQCFKEVHHPEIYNQPNANVHVTIELNMYAEKKTRYVDNFNRIAAIPYKFEHGEEREIIAFSKSLENQNMAKDAGAQMAGGEDLIKMIQAGQISVFDFKFVIAHPDILSELVVLRGLMKRKFPNVRNDTLTPDLGQAVNKLMNGISYTAKKNDFANDFGLIETIIGTVDMDATHLEQNFKALVQDVNTMKPKREGDFITRCLLWSPPSREKLMLDYERYQESSEKTKIIAKEENKDELRQQAVV